MNLLDNRFGSFRRLTHEVRAGSARIGGRNPILVQSMTNTLTRDVDATAAQTLALARAGCELVRITAPTVADAACLRDIAAKVRASGCDVPLCADIHFQPAAAFEALKWVEKVRINPGNFAEASTARVKEVDDDAYERGLQKVSEKFRPFVREARERGVALRLGINHGSLSDRILSRHGNTPEGMLVSALEYLAICEEERFDQIVFSIKSSNPKVVVQCYRLFVERLERDGHAKYPIHLGVTEAGEGRDGRLKSAVGIGSLLLDGIGDTIRVSLTEDPVEEIPVARELVAACARPFSDEGPCLDFSGQSLSTPHGVPSETIDLFSYARRQTRPVQIGSTTAGLGNMVRVGGADAKAGTADRPVEWTDTPAAGAEGDFTGIRLAVDSGFDPGQPREYLEHGTPVELTFRSFDRLDDIVRALPASNLYIASCELERCGPWGARRLLASLDAAGLKVPFALRWKLDGTSRDELRMAATLGSLLIDGYGDLLRLAAPDESRLVDLSYDLLQAAGARRSKTEFISCPSCGRTLFDLVSTSARIRAVTGHLKDVSIAIMGCIVNGPGEMADADFGYVGGTPGTVNLFVRRDCVRKGVPEADAPQALIDLIKEHGRWVEPPDSTSLSSVASTHRERSN